MAEIEQLSVLQCILCRNTYSMDDVRTLEYFPRTGICFDCYAKAQKAAYVNWCFGKRTLYSIRDKVLALGYDPDAKPCSKECLDRKICPLFVSNEIFIWRAEMGKQVKVEDAPVGELHAPKKVKPYKGPQLPFPQITAMTTQAFLLCMKGILITDLVAWVKAQGGEPRRVLRLMRKGERHGKRWQVHEKNGYLKIVYQG